MIGGVTVMTLINKYWDKLIWYAILAWAIFLVAVIYFIPLPLKHSAPCCASEACRRDMHHELPN